MIYTQYHEGIVREEVINEALGLIDVAVSRDPLSRGDAQMLLKGAIYDVEIFKALDEGYKLHKDRKYDDVFERFRAAERSIRSLELGSMGSCFDEGGRKEYYGRIKRKEASVQRFPLGVADLDKLIKGGLGRGELGCILAAEKDGKSMALAHIAASTVLLGYNAVYISAELDRKDVENRFSSNVTGIPLDYIECGGDEAAKEVERRLEDIMGKSGGKIVFKKFPPGIASVGDVTAYLLDVYRFWDIKPDVLVVDYADELAVKKVRGNRESNHYQDLGQIYTELLALAAPESESSSMVGGLNCAVWTASQIQRSAIGKDVTDFRHVADSILKAAKVSLMVGICRDNYERESNIMRLYLALCRFAPFPKELGPYKRDYAHGRLMELTDAVKRFDAGSLAWIKRSGIKASDVKKSKTPLKKHRLRKMCL
jgi:hypothetical protein